MRSPKDAMKAQTEMNVKIVQALIDEGLSRTQVAKELGISKPMVVYYANGGTWKTKTTKEN